MPKKRKTSTHLKLKKAGGSLENRIPFIRIVYLSLVINILIVLFAVIFIDKLPPEIPLYYGLPNGTGQIANKDKIILPSVAAMAFIIINSAIAMLIKNDFLKKALIITGFMLSVFSLTTTLKIMFLVGNF